MMIRKMRLLLSRKSELGAARTIVDHNKRKRLNETIMRAGRAHRRRNFGVPDRSVQGDRSTSTGPRKEIK